MTYLQEWNKAIPLDAMEELRAAVRKLVAGRDAGSPSTGT